MPLTIGQMIEEIRANNIEKGWRSPTGGPGSNTLGDYVALLHTEIGEATDAYRRWKLDDGTAAVPGIGLHGLGRPDPAAPLPKPEGVGSELADILIRLLDTGDVFGFEVFERDLELGDVASISPHTVDPQLPPLLTFGDHMAWLARRTDKIWTDQAAAPALALRALVTVARRYGIDLDFEYARKMAYNRTRPFRHGGRALSEAGA